MLAHSLDGSGQAWEAKGSWRQVIIPNPDPPWDFSDSVPTYSSSATEPQTMVTNHR